MTTAAPLDPAVAARQARAEQRSAQLLDAAARLMERDGLHAVSMQAVATEAGVSVGLIYRYFGGKDDLLLAVIVGVLDSFATEVPAAVEAAGEDPVHRLAAAFRSYCEVIDERRHAAVLTYRETKSLDDAGRTRIMDLEVRTSEPLRAVLREGVDAGLFTVPDLEFAAYDLLLLAHAWALKHWYFERTLSLDTYVQHQFALVLKGILEPRHRRKYARLVSPT
jgi:AcrR family transcriptional regulator